LLVGVLGRSFELPLVLAAYGNQLKRFDSLGFGGCRADEFPEVALAAAEVAPGKHLLAGVPNVNAKLQGFVEQEGLLVLVQIDVAVLTGLVLEQLLLAFLVYSGYDELVVVLGARAADGRSGVLVDELGVALEGQWADDVELAVWDFDDGLLRRVAKEPFANCTTLAVWAGRRTTDGG
jgi:hypothetical protein